ncbi:hypothetical protein DSM3645_17650 [Blastopirellula marina DSM 3645]|uniref:Uncharacterized protein n=1 Tax=Blastopirellula marina DSM 3645 TaxID=314230 RepID=A3ZNV2_9BACT|nr:hypothetical protein DSM3645_17650 [Blastopirellula marina DSM 3645]
MGDEELRVFHGSNTFEKPTKAK